MADIWTHSMFMEVLKTLNDESITIIHTYIKTTYHE